MKHAPYQISPPSLPAGSQYTSVTAVVLPLSNWRLGTGVLTFCGKKRNCKQTLRIHVWCAYTYIYLKINQTKVYIYAIHRFLGDENKYTNRIYTNLIFVGEDEVELTESFPFILVGPGILIICFWEPYHELRFPPIWYLAVGRMVIFSPLLGGNQEKRRLTLADLKTYCPLSIAYAYYIYICVNKCCFLVS